MLSLIFGGLLPIIAFTIIEDKYGVIAGLIAAMIFGLGEISWELFRYKKIAKMTLIGNGLILILGAVSLISTDGIWFKLQPALFCVGFGVFLIFSYIIKKPLLITLAKAQNQELPELVSNFMTGLTLRLGLFFFAQAGLGVWAALHWSTSHWALLKGIGLPIMMLFYMAFEIIIMRLRIKNK